MAELNLLVAFVLKPWVIIINAIILMHVWRYRAIHYMRIFLFSMALFLIGELFCAMDVYFIKHMSLWNEGIHEVLMMFSFGILFVGLHDYFLKEKSCINLSCDQLRSCLLKPADCIHRGQYGFFFGWFILGITCLGIIPMFASPEVLASELSAGIGDRILGTYMYDRSESLSFLQQKIIPLLAVVLLGYTGIGYLIRKNLTRSLVWTLSLGLGTLLFAYFRLTLVHFFHPNITLTSFGEEFLELLFVVLFLIWIKHPSRLSIPE